MPEFTLFEEHQIILLALDNPDFFHRIIRFMKPEYFDDDVNQYLMTILIDYYEKYELTPPKDVVKNIVYDDLKTDDELSEPVISLLDEEIDIRGVPYIKDKILNWAKHKQLSMLYNDDIIDAARNGDLETVEQVINDAHSISDVIIKPLVFFDDVSELFHESEYEHYTTGFTALDDKIHDGRGPARKEVFLWIAPTGVGKSIMLVNTSIANTMNGKNVLHITLENSEKVTGHRYLGAFTDIPIAYRKQDTHKSRMEDKIRKIKSSGNSGELYILYFPTDSVSTREIELSVKELDKIYSFKPDMIVIDYLECLLSKNSYKNKEDYTRQKSVANEIRSLAAVTNTFVASASQTNRSGSSSADEDKNINLDKIAESYGKAMPTDYIVSINQSSKDYGASNGDSHIGHVRFYTAKNRNGPKNDVIQATINYLTMKAEQEE